MLIMFFDCYEIVHYEFEAEGQTFNAAFYVGVLAHLK